MKHKKIQYLRAKWFRFKTNQFNMAGIRTGAKHGVIAAIFYLFILNPLIWIFLGHLYNSDDKFISIGLVIFSTSLVFAAIFMPLFMVLGAAFGLVIAKSLEKHLFDWSKSKFFLKSTMVAVGIAILLILIGGWSFFDMTQSESLFNFVLIWIAPILALVGFVGSTSLVLFQRGIEGRL